MYYVIMNSFRELFLPQNKNITTSYDRLKDFTQYIPAYLELIKKSLGEELSHANYELAFFLNSSDSLTSLKQLDQKGKKVMTVAGSGEFSHVFIKNGASEIQSFDVSPAAAFNAELRHMALCSLQMADYLKLFSSWTEGWDDTNNDYPIYDQDTYLKIKDKLSAEAQLYFDLLFREPELITFHREVVLQGFARTRINKKHGFNRLIGDIITTEEEYDELQKKAKKVKFAQVICRVNEIADLIASQKPDQIYQSNIGFTLDRVVKNAYANANNGSEVVCTVGLGTEDLKETEGNFFYQGKKIEIGDEITHEIKDHNQDTVQVPIRIIGLDGSATFGVTIMINPTFPTGSSTA